ncbi:MAG: WG repeat-containing protein [Bacteroidota bacterium]
MFLRWVFSISIVLSTCTILYSATSSINSLIARHDYMKAKALLDKYAIKDTNDYAINYYFACYYYQSADSLHSYFDALYQISESARKYNANQDAKLLLRNNKLPVTSNEINKLYHQIELEIYAASIQQNQLALYEKSIQSPIVDTFIRNDLIKHRNDRAYMYANAQNDFMSFKEFMEKYPESNQAGLARENYEKLLFKSVTDINTWQAYKEYIDKYPDAYYRDTAKARYEILLYADFSKDADPSKLYSYICNYPTAPFHLEAEKYLFQLSCKAFTDEQLIAFIDRYPKSTYGWKKAWDYFYLYQTAADRPVDYINFIQQYPNYYNINRFRKDSTQSYWKLDVFEKDDLSGYMIQDTIIHISALYQEAGSFNTKLALISTSCVNDKCTYSYIDKENHVLPTIFDEAYDFEDAVAIVGIGDCPERNCLHGLINELGDTIVPFIYPEINDLSDGLFLVNDARGKWGYINNRGEIKIAFNYTKARNFRDSFAYVAIDTAVFFIDQTGARQKQFPAFKIAGDFKENVCTYSLDGAHWGLMNKEGKIIFEAIYQEMIVFENGIAIAKKEDAITRKGKTKYVLNTYQLNIDGSFKLKK